MPDRRSADDASEARPDEVEPDDHGGEPDDEAARGDATGLRALVDARIQQVSDGQARLANLIEKNKDRPLLDVVLRFYQRDLEAAGTIVGSALAFRLFLFVVPMLLFVVGVVGFIAPWTTPEDINQAAGVTGSLAQQIDTALTQPNSTRWIATIAGLFGMVWAGRSLSKVMVSASCLAWRLPVTTKASVRLIGAVVGLIVGVGLVSAIVNRIRLELGLGAASVSFLVALAFYAVAWIALSMLLPRATNDPSALLPGAMLVGVAVAGMQAVSQLYLPDRLGRASQLYGAIGITLVTLGWFFILGRTMVLGMSLDAVIHERFGSISRFLFSLPIIRVLSRKSRWIRTFFDLDE